MKFEPVGTNEIYTPDGGFGFECANEEERDRFLKCCANDELSQHIFFHVAYKQAFARGAMWGASAIWIAWTLHRWWEPTP